MPSPALADIKMLLEFFIAFAALCAIAILFGSNGRKTGKNGLNLPPGPYQWPIVGNLPQVAMANPDFPHLAFEKLAKTYGDVISVKFGVHNAILLSSYEAIRDLLGKDEFSGRYEGFPHATDRSFNTTMGIVFTSGENWKAIRRFTVRVLRDFGFGKRNSMATVMAEELSHFCQGFESKAHARNGLVTIEPDLFALSFVNILWSFVAGYRFSHSDQRLKSILRLNDEVMGIWNHSSLTVPFPILRHWLPGSSNLNNQMKVYNKLHTFMKGLIAQVETAYETESAGNPRTFLECFIQEIYNTKDQKDSFFTVNQLNMVLQDLFLGGSETTSNTITYAVLYMVLYPEVQEKVYAEIKQVSEASNHGNDHNDLLSLTDLSRMPYTEATIQEIFRFSHVVPITAARKCMADYVYRNYFIPEGTCVFVNIAGVLMDKRHWGDPEVFRPERFLDSTGTKIVNLEQMIPFGFGKRVCVAESMARESFFLFFTGLLKKYKFEVPPGTTSPSPDPMVMFTLRPRPYDVLITPRK